MSTAARSVGFIGLGQMGYGMAGNLLKAGHDVLAYDVTLRTCTADSWMLRSLEGAILRGEYPPGTFLGLKDLTAALESGRSVHQAMPVTSLARELYQLIDAKLGGLHGSNEVLCYYLEP